MYDVMPRVSVQRDLAGRFEDIDVDYPAVISYMRNRGFSDEQISDLQITIDNRLEIHVFGDEPESTGVTHGRFIEEDKSIAIYPLAPLITYNYSRFGEAFSDEIDDGTGPYVSSATSRTVIHELEHFAIHELEGGMEKENRKHIGKAALKAFAVFGLTFLATRHAWNEISGLLKQKPHASVQFLAGIGAAGIAARLTAQTETYAKLMESAYLTLPEEVRCNEAMNQVDHTFISLKPKNVLADLSAGEPQLSDIAAD